MLNEPLESEEDFNARIAQAEANMVNVDKVFEIMKTLQAIKLTKNDGLPIEVISGLYIGSIGAAYNQELLLQTVISHILTVANKIKPRFEKLFTYKIIGCIDNET